MKNILSIAGFILIGTIFGFAQNADNRIHTTEQLTNGPIINGILDDDCWKSFGNWDGDFIQYEPNEGKQASQNTDFKVLYDNQFLYIAIRSYDNNPDSIINRLSRKDAINGDYVSISIDSHHSTRTAFTFQVSSSGVKQDLIQSDVGNKIDLSWNPIWYVKTQIHDWGWTAEIKIPFTQLRFNKYSNKIWGFEVERFIARYNEINQWKLIPRDASSKVSHFGKLAGLKNIKARKQFDLTPYGVLSLDTYEAEKGNPYKSGNNTKLNTGLNGKIGITNNLTLDIAINPDFGQVEADPSQVNLSAYESYFQEKRPFFIEGNDITDFSLGESSDVLFYSRRVGRKPQGYVSTEENEFIKMPQSTKILAAAKLSGKTKNGMSIGIIESITSNEFAQISNEGEERSEKVEPLTNYFIARVQKDFNKGQMIIGGMITNTLRNTNNPNIAFFHKSATTGGFDFIKYFKNKQWMLSSELMFSQIRGGIEALQRTQLSSTHYFQRPDASNLEYDENRTSLFGHGGNIKAGKIGGKIKAAISLSWKSPGLNLNDLGYLRSNNSINQTLSLSYTFTKPFHIFRNMNLKFVESMVWDFSGKHLANAFDFSVETQFKNHWSFMLSGEYHGKSISLNYLRGGPSYKLPNGISVGYYLRTAPRRKLMFTFLGSHTKYAFNNFKSSHNSLEIKYQVFENLSLTLSPSYNNTMRNMQYIASKKVNDDNRYLFAQLNQKTISISLRLSYNLTPDLTIEYWGQAFSSSGKYDAYKKISNPMADHYNNRFHCFSNDEITFEEKENSYYIDENSDGVNDYSFKKPDFSVAELLSNLVVRWEFFPGSELYFVWSQTRDYMDQTGLISMDTFRRLFSNKKAYNIFLIKYSYRIGL